MSRFLLPLLFALPLHLAADVDLSQSPSYFAYGNRAATRIISAQKERKAEISKIDITAIDYAPPTGHIRNIRYGISVQSTDEDLGGRFQTRFNEMHLGLRTFDDAWRVDLQRSDIKLTQLNSSIKELGFLLDRAYMYRNISIGNHSVHLGAVHYNISCSLESEFQGLLPYFSYAYQLGEDWSFSFLRSATLALEYAPKGSTWKARMIHGSFSPSLYYIPSHDQLQLLYNDFAVGFDYHFNDHVVASFELGGYTTEDSIALSDLNRHSLKSGSLAYQSPIETFKDLRISGKFSPYIGVSISGSWK